MTAGTMNRTKPSPPPRETVSWQGNPALEPFLVPLDDLHEDPANARRHPERNLAAIRASLARFRQQTPVVVDAGGVVRKGNGTLQAARALGWSYIAAVLSDLSGADLAGYAIADNRTGELAEWDDEALAAILEGLKAEDDFPIEATGFDDAEVAVLLEKASREIVLPDPEPQKEPELKAEHLIEIYCSAEALESFRPILDEWAAHDGCTVNIS